MPQIIEENRKPSFIDRLGGGIENAGQEAGNMITQRLMGLQRQQQQSETAKKLQQLTGMDLSGLSPEMQKSFSEISLKNQQEKKADQFKRQIEDDRYNTIKKHFGEKEAEIYKAAPEGGKTEILKHLYDKEERERGLDQSLQDQGIFPEEEGEEGPAKPREKFIDYDKGLTPKERVRRQEARYSINLPLYNASVEKLQALDSEKDHLNILEELSPQIQAIERLNINPQSGELILPGLSSPEAQRYIKTLNDFTTNAKDSYGARVTNFDLQQYMKRLPSLANSQEARSQIIRQMQIINDANSMREKAIQDVIDAHGGIRNIDYDKAKSMAIKKITPQSLVLKAEFKKIDKKLEDEYQAKIKERKRITPKGMVAVRNKDGTEGYIKAEMVKEYLADKEGELL